MHTVAIIQARLQSTRLPGKILLDVGGRPMLQLIVDRVKRSHFVDKICIATDQTPGNDKLVAIASMMGVEIFRGDEDDVLARYAGAASELGADIVMRVTSDCPFIDPEILDALIQMLKDRGLDYATNVMPPSWPDGLDASVFTRSLLEAAATEAMLKSQREHVVPWMWDQCNLTGASRFQAANLAAPKDLSHHRWTVDERKDYEFVQAVAVRFGGDLVTTGWGEILAVVESDPALKKMNQHISRDEGYRRSLANEQGAKR